MNVGLDAPQSTHVLFFGASEPRAGHLKCVPSEAKSNLLMCRGWSEGVSIYIDHVRTDQWCLAAARASEASWAQIERDGGTRCAETLQRCPNGGRAPQERAEASPALTGPVARCFYDNGLNSGLIYECPKRCSKRGNSAAAAGSTSPTSARSYADICVYDQVDRLVRWPPSDRLVPRRPEPPCLSRLVHLEGDQWWTSIRSSHARQAASGVNDTFFPVG